MKKMIALLAIAFVSAGIALNAQPKKGGPDQPRPTREQMVEFQCMKLVEELALDDATADRFVPVFKAYKNDIFAVKQKYQPAKKEVEPGAEPARKTDAEIEQMILNRFAQSREIVDVRESYYKKFRAFLSPRQIQKIYDQEKNQGHGMKHEQMNRGGGAPCPGNGRPGNGPGPGFGKK